MWGGLGRGGEKSGDHCPDLDSEDETSSKQMRHLESAPAVKGTAEIDVDCTAKEPMPALLRLPEEVGWGASFLADKAGPCPAEGTPQKESSSDSGSNPTAVIRV